MGPRRLVVGAAALLASLACAGFGTTQPPPRVERSLEDAVPVEPPEVEVPLTKTPPAGVWLAVAARPEAGERSWTPVATGAAAALFDPGEWEGVAAGVEVSAVGIGGKVQLVYGGLQEIPYGCDDRVVTVALFDGPELPEGPVWIGEDWKEAVVLVPRLSREPSPTRRLYRVGGMAEVDVKRNASRSGVTVLELGGGRPFREDWAVPDMAGADDVSIDLRRDTDIGPLYPALYLNHADYGALLFLRSQSFEGVVFRAISVAHGRSEEAARAYLYRCAF